MFVSCGTYDRRFGFRTFQSACFAFSVVGYFACCCKAVQAIAATVCFAAPPPPRSVPIVKKPSPVDDRALGVSTRIGVTPIGDQARRRLGCNEKPLSSHKIRIASSLFCFFKTWPNVLFPRVDGLLVAFHGMDNG